VSADIGEVNGNDWMSYELKRSREDSLDAGCPFALTYAR
jgi:hypothetical protein